MAWDAVDAVLALSELEVVPSQVSVIGSISVSLLGSLVIGSYVCLAVDSTTDSVSNRSENIIPETIMQTPMQQLGRV